MHAFCRILGLVQAVHEGAGATRAQLRAEEFTATKRVFSSWTVNPDFTPGFKFEVTGAPVGELDTEYLLTRVLHEASQHSSGAGSGAYKNTIEAIAFEVPYRAPRVTPGPDRPRGDGGTGVTGVTGGYESIATIFGLRASTFGISTVRTPSRNFARTSSDASPGRRRLRMNDPNVRSV